MDLNTNIEELEARVAPSASGDIVYTGPVNLKNHADAQSYPIPME